MSTRVKKDTATNTATKVLTELAWVLLDTSMCAHAHTHTYTHNYNIVVFIWGIPLKTNITQTIMELWRQQCWLADLLVLVCFFCAVAKVVTLSLSLPCMCRHFGILSEHSHLCLPCRLLPLLDDPQWSDACCPAERPAGSP